MFSDFEYSNKSVYSQYKTMYQCLCSHIACLNYDIEYNSPYYISMASVRLYNYTFMFEGYIECLFDLEVINDIDYFSFYVFIKAIREECIIIKERCYNE